MLKLHHQKFSHVLVVEGPKSQALYAALGERSELVLEAIPQDPERWPSFFSQLSPGAWVAIIEHPSLVTGFSWPESWFERLWQQLRKHSRDNPIYVDDSATLFSYDETPPGSFDTFWLSDPNLFKIGRLCPIYSPQGPDLCWIISNFELSKLADQSPRPAELSFAFRVLSQFRSRQGQAPAEFARRLLAVRQNLRLFVDQLRPLYESKKLSIGYWPTVGLSIELKITALTDASDIDRLCVDVAKDCASLPVPGRFMGAKNSIFVCFAANEAALLRLARSLKKSLT